MSYMKSFVLLTVVVLAAACSRNEPSAPANEPTAVVEADANAQVASCPGNTYSAVPEGVDLQGQYYIHNDRVYETKEGVERRHTSLELMSGDAVQIAKGVAQQYVEKGFRQMEIKDRGDGVTRLAVLKPGVGRINIDASADHGKNPSNQRSVGVISFDWVVGQSMAPTTQGAGDPVSTGG